MTQQQPRPGDTVRVTRTITTTEVYEGLWVEADESPTGNHALDCTDGTWRRVRDLGPITFGGDDYETVETDTFEVIARA